MSKKVVWPQGAADKVAIAFAAVMAHTIDNTRTHLTIGQMTAPGTLNLTLHAEQRVGDKLTIAISADATGRTITPGTGMAGLAIALTASKSYNLTYEFNGTAFSHIGTQILN